MGGQYKAVRNLAASYYELGHHEHVKFLLEEADQIRQERIDKGAKPKPDGLVSELKGELKLAESDLHQALNYFHESRMAYTKSKTAINLGMLDAKIALFTLATGEPSIALRMSKDVIDCYRDSTNQRILAYNAVTSIKLSLCGQLDRDAAFIEEELRDWVKKNPGNQRILDLLEWAKDEAVFPCPEWR